MSLTFISSSSSISSLPHGAGTLTPSWICYHSTTAPLFSVKVPFSSPLSTHTSQAKTHLPFILIAIAAMKGFQMGLWSIWLSGLLLICLSLYTTQRLPSVQERIERTHFSHGGFADLGTPKITLFSVPISRTGSIGARQSSIIRSWLALSPQITVVLCSTDSSVFASVAAFGSRVVVESDIDFTFLGTPFFHSIVARAQAFESDISVLIDPLTILFPDFVSTLSFAHKLDNDWLLFASIRNISYFPFHFNESGNRWVKENGKLVRTQELREVLNQNSHWNCCGERMLVAWNNGVLPLHSGVLPPFLLGKGIHNHWLINEALSSGFRFVFDASLAISSFYLNDSEDQSSISINENRSWEYIGNSHFGALYGSLFFHEANHSRLPKLMKCDKDYLFFDPLENNVYSSKYKSSQGLLLKEAFLHSWKKKKKTMACINVMKSADRTLDCSLKDQLLPSITLQAPFSLESLLLLVADKNKTIVLSVAGYSYKDMLMSWACRLRRLRITNFLVCALDLETYQLSVLQGLPVFMDPSAPSNISYDDCHFGTKCFQRVTKVKSRIVLKILKLGYNVLLSDVDVYWFQNPLPLLLSFGPGVLAAQSDEYKKTGPINLPRRLNSGFYFARSDEPTIASMEKVVKHAATSGLSEQPSFYDTLCGEGGSNRVSDERCLEPDTNLTVHFLDRNLFPNGAYQELWERRDVKAKCVKMGCLVLHNNWVSGRRKKLERQVSSGLWEYDTGSRMCLQSWHKRK